MEMRRKVPRMEPMSPELEMLDQLLGGDLPVAVVRSFFDDDQRFVHAALVMLNAREIKLLDEDGTDIPKWKWSEILKSNAGNPRIQITDGGITRIA
jgi:hypothetical protein